MSQPQEALAPCRWLFVRHGQYIQVVRLRGLSMAIDLARHSFGRYRFENEHQLETFQVALAEQLTERGWLLSLSTSR
jgi:hypothetical protein